MTTRLTQNLRIKFQKPLWSPSILQEQCPLPMEAAHLITDTRALASQIIHGHDDRLLVVVGPCSIHEPNQALDYAKKLQPLLSQYSDTLCILMRVYFEKPRTTVGWKGLINDPDLSNEFNINKGLKVARELLRDLSLLGVPAGTEFLDTIIPQYISDLVCWGAIGARTTESQIHRELVSGLSMPIGFKNGTTGNVDIALDAIISSSNPHHFLGVTSDGLAAITSTVGNHDTHIILRGSKGETNYQPSHIAQVSKALSRKKIEQGIMVDCSHGNSGKDHTRQKEVVASLCEQLARGERRLIGAMIESHLFEGSQKLSTPQTLQYGVSITDACVGFDETEQLLSQLSEAVLARRKLA